MDIRIALSRFGAYTLSTTLFILSLVVPYYLIEGHRLYLLFLALSLFWAFTFRPLSLFLITTAKRKFIKGFYDAPTVIQELTEMLEVESSRRTIFEAMLFALDDALEIEDSGFLVAVRDETETRINFYQHYPKDIEYPLDHPLITYFSTSPEIQSFTDLPEHLRTELSGDGFNKRALFIPLLSPEGLEGVLMLGERSSQRAYKKEDLGLMNQVRSYGMGVLYRLTPYEKIEAKFNESQKRLVDLEKQAARATRLEAMTQVWNQVHHELRTPLSIIKMNTNNTETAEELPEHKEAVNKQIERATEIIDTMLTLSRSPEKNMVAVDIKSLMLKVHDQFPQDGVRFELGEIPAVTVQGVAMDLESVFNNLITNAREAMDHKGTIQLEGQIQKTDIILTLRDDGPGIPEDIMPRIWDPFFTTRTGINRGLGLSLVLKIINDHQGAIDVKSSPAGTIFSIRLPVIQYKKT